MVIKNSEERSQTMPKNEPVKLVYTTQNCTTATIVMNNNNRATFSSAPIQNGTITLSPMTANTLTQPAQGQQQTTVMQARVSTGSAQPQTPTLIFKTPSNSTTGTLITSSVSKANHQVS